MIGEERSGPAAGAGREGLGHLVDPATLELPLLRNILEYWRKKRGDRAMPARRDIDPQELKQHLRNLFLLNVEGDDFRYRLLGSAITERYGRNSTGKLVSEVYASTPPIREWYLETLRAVAREKRPVLAFAPLRAIKKEFILIEALHLPLSNDEKTINMIFGAAHFTVQRPAR